LNKVNKITEKKIIKALTEVCEKAKTEINGFQWLTHFVDYKQFPDSLKVVCVFSTQTELLSAQHKALDQIIFTLIQNKLEKVGIQIKNIKKHVYFDSEEACNSENNGNWDERVRSH